MEEPQVDNQNAVEEWIISMIEDLSRLSQLSSTWSICKVPKKLRSVKEDAYDPRIVSIGPIHYGEEHLLPMEDHKQYYLLSLLQRTPDAVVSLENCCRTILSLDSKVRDCYADPIEPNKLKLATILLQDAGFMLELFLKYSEMGSKVHDDPIFSTSWMILTLKRDLALLENQIPFFVLKSLFKLAFPRGVNGVLSLNELALQFYKSTLNINEEAFIAKCSLKGKHLLHLLYNCYLPPSPKFGSRSKEAWDFIHCATALSYAGVFFERNESENLFDLKFSNGIFQIPTLRIHDSTDSLFRNFIAYEQCQQDSAHYITSYCMLMDRLIDTAKDVELLEKKRIIENDLGGGEDVSDVFNNICKQVVLKDFYFAELCDRVNGFCKTPWHSYKAELKRNYFKNPWSTISFLAAIALIALTALQTVYSVLSYYHR
ncbi:UPF0481 protein At3g47200-like [Tripterygium wilfordii]|uniref:UPF0481 protein At3g47200-like n=1 Tax=Tripterygium wilfordii TaxID=458696 RepID=UPI0018F81404|nr:UPF0481 protein At3g47200-like [Tripterygium wilfordii]